MPTVKLEARNGMFFAKCALNATPDIEMWGMTDSGSAVTFLTSSICERAGLKHKGHSKKLLCSHGKRHGMAVPTYRGAITIGGVTVKCVSLAYDGKLGAGGIRADATLGTSVPCNFGGDLGWGNGTGIRATQPPAGHGARPARPRRFVPQDGERAGRPAPEERPG